MKRKYKIIWYVNCVATKEFIATALYSDTYGYWEVKGPDTQSYKGNNSLTAVNRMAELVGHKNYPYDKFSATIFELEQESVHV